MAQRAGQHLHTTRQRSALALTYLIVLSSQGLLALSEHTSHTGASDPSLLSAADRRLLEKKLQRGSKADTSTNFLLSKFKSLDSSLTGKLAARAAALDSEDLAARVRNRGGKRRGRRPAKDGDEAAKMLGTRDGPAGHGAAKGGLQSVATVRGGKKRLGGDQGPRARNVGFVKQARQQAVLADTQTNGGKQQQRRLLREQKRKGAPRRAAGSGNIGMKSDVVGVSGEKVGDLNADAAAQLNNHPMTLFTFELGVLAALAVTLPIVYWRKMRTRHL